MQPDSYSNTYSKFQHNSICKLYIAQISIYNDYDSKIHAMENKYIFMMSRIVYVSFETVHIVIRLPHLISKCQKFVN